MNIKLTLVIFSSFLVCTPLVASANGDWEGDAADAWIDGKAETVLLLNDNLNSFKIDTLVKNGVVTLSGEVESHVDKALAYEIIKSLDGVKRVSNELSVMKKASGTGELGADLNDAKIAAVVKTRLLLEPEVTGSAIEVQVEKGQVTLKGNVDTEAEKDLALLIAENTGDIKRVISKLTVQ